MGKKAEEDEKKWQESIKELRKQHTDEVKKETDNEKKLTDELKKRNEGSIKPVEDRLKAKEMKVEDEKKALEDAVKATSAKDEKVADLKADMKRNVTTYTEKYYKVGIMDKHVTQASDKSVLKLQEIESAIEQSEAAAKLKVKELVLSKMRHTNAHTEASSKHADAIVKKQKASQDENAHAFDKFVKDESARMEKESDDLAKTKKDYW